MFGRKDVATAASDAVDNVSPYVDRLAHDEKFRRRLAAAITAGAAAQKRAKRQAGLLGLGVRLGTDPVLRAQLSETVLQLQKANSRLKKHRSHKLRNVLFLVAAGGIGAAAVPGVRDAVMSKVNGDHGDHGHDHADHYDTTPTAVDEPANDTVTGTSANN